MPSIIPDGSTRSPRGCRRTTDATTVSRRGRRRSRARAVGCRACRGRRRTACPPGRRCRRPDRRSCPSSSGWSLSPAAGAGAAEADSIDAGAALRVDGFVHSGHPRSRPRAPSRRPTKRDCMSWRCCTSVSRRSERPSKDSIGLLLRLARAARSLAGGPPRPALARRPGSGRPPSEPRRASERRPPGLPSRMPLGLLGPPWRGAASTASRVARTDRRRAEDRRAGAGSRPPGASAGCSLASRISCSSDLDLLGDLRQVVADLVGVVAASHGRELAPADLGGAGEERNIDLGGHRNPPGVGERFIFEARPADATTSGQEFTTGVATERNGSSPRCRPPRPHGEAPRRTRRSPPGSARGRASAS